MLFSLITRPDFFEGESNWLQQCFAAGLPELHLRKPNASTADLEHLLLSLPEAYHERIILHDGFALTARFALKGVHLNRRHPIPPQGYQGLVGRSCHHLDEVAHYKAQCDYLWLSPIFDSISKPGYAAAFTPEILASAGAQGLIDRQVIALGGITPERIPQLCSWGFGGAAVLGDIWQAPEEKRLLRLQTFLNSMTT